MPPAALLTTEPSDGHHKEGRVEPGACESRRNGPSPDGQVYSTSHQPPSTPNCAANRTPSLRATYFDSPLFPISNVSAIRFPAAPSP